MRETSNVLISVIRCAYLSNFNLLLISILASDGTVSSKMDAVLAFLSSMTMSGFSVVTITLGGRVPPAGVCMCIFPGLDLVYSS